uniref:Nucleoside diphosphate kinase 7 n=1 Tax=Cacopsylla melanoneura TaxID=428564 RepID=A0A8D8YQT7_9HEMI
MSTSRSQCSFLVEWFDTESSTTRTFVLNFWTNDQNVEMIDVKKNKIFLRKTSCDGVLLKDLFVGNSVKVFSRILKIVNYADAYTKNYLESTNYQCSVALFRPHANDKKSELLQDLINHGFEFINLVMIEFNEDIKKAMSQSESTARIPISSMLNGPVVVFQVRSINAVQKLQDVIGPEDREEALSNYPHSVRSRYPQWNASNLYVANEDTYQQLSHIFFPTSDPKVTLRPHCLLNNTTLCIIKPHALKQGNMANILRVIEENRFEISGMRMLLMDHSSVVRLLEIYQGVVSEYPGYVTQLLSGKCLALEINGPLGTQDTPQQFRELAGPANVEVAKELRPHTIRAKYGRNPVENAVHVTDLPEDAYFEVEFVFRTI